MLGVRLALNHGPLCFVTCPTNPALGSFPCSLLRVHLDVSCRLATIQSVWRVYVTGLSIHVHCRPCTLELEVTQILESPSLPKNNGQLVCWACILATLMAVSCLVAYFAPGLFSIHHLLRALLKTLLAPQSSSTRWLPSVGACLSVSPVHYICIIENSSVGKDTNRCLEGFLWKAAAQGTAVPT